MKIALFQEPPNWKQEHNDNTQAENMKHIDNLQIEQLKKK